MSKNTKRFLLSSVIAVIVGLTLFSVSFTASAGKLGIVYNNGKWRYIYDGVESLPKQAITAYENVDLKLKYISLEFVESDNYYIEIENNREIEYKVENNTLIIDATDSFRDGMTIMNFSMKDTNPKVKLYIPKGTEFKDFKIETDGANNKLNSITAKNLNVQSSFSNVEINNCDIDTLKIKGGSNYDINNSQFENADIISKYSNFDINNSSFSTSFTADITSANLVCDGFTADNVVINGAFSTVDIDKATINNFESDCKQNNLDIAGTLTGRIVSYVQFGNIDFDLDGNLDDYNITNELSMGNASINGKNLQRHEIANAKNSIDITGESSNVHIKIK